MQTISIIFALVLRSRPRTGRT